MAQMNLRKYARDKPCMVRIPGVCNHDPETTVLAHLGGAGMGRKENDFIAAWCCSDCHDVYDGRQNLPLEMEPWDLDIAFSEGVRRTQQELLKTLNKHGFTLAEAIEEWAKGLEV